jgi:hypothetical protein
LYGSMDEKIFASPPFSFSGTWLSHVWSINLSSKLHLVWLQVVYQCYLMLAKQRDLLKLHKPPQSKDKLKDQDLKVSMAAGSLFGDKASLMSARYVISAVQSVNSALACHWGHDSVWKLKPYIYI